MPAIQLLDESTINKIAAGEVIERPASVVKELLENCLDAGATRISIEVEAGGTRLIRVSDNGVGIPKEELALALQRHATSKIRRLEDIYSSTTLGFRGEALASIAHVAQVRLESRHKGAASAWVIESEEGQHSEPQMTVLDMGTVIEVKSLFQRIPVRLKYLKNPGAELSAIFNIVLPYALLFPDVDFVLTNGVEDLINTTGISDVQILAAKFWGISKEKFLPISGQGRSLGISGFVTDPTLTFPNRGKEFLAVNRRVVKSPVLQKMISDTFRDVIPHGRYPAVLLNITVEPAIVDVNIHPKKTEVKFLRSDAVFSELPRLIKPAFSRSHSVLDPASIQRTDSDSPAVDGARQLINAESTTFFDMQNFQPPAELALPLIQGFSDEVLQQEQLIFFQVFDTYLVVKAKDGVWILDQHAVHERILYEKLKAAEAETMGSQQALLISEVVQLNQDQMAVYREAKPLLDDWLCESEEFGRDQILIRKVPVELGNASVSEWVLNLLDLVKDDLRHSDLPGRKEALQMKACKAAIKAGRRLLPVETEQLLRDFMASEANFTCPHGRPLYIKFAKSELEKLFLRR